ncbi:N-acetylmuramoyl-L-alanine amidase [Isoptericola sp. S6320L]|uniref:N-acetylmuramoyl-L-alanine amidase n=1 Tax=Isoptericola sp. S6320L TaxID=2926411 RepID=UPI001FF16ACD|nr:N-acetylmuramoyl-L-alanine amidase [Isoptericola sp. S6320L]MCK0117816.1 N-acetylmuramoyl-L-alanine amidase [Isoptericola sp. S6320L]
MNRLTRSRTRSALATGVVGLLSFALVVPPGAQAAPLVEAAPSAASAAVEAADETAPDPAAAEPVAPESEEAEFVPAEELADAEDGAEPEGEDATPEEDATPDEDAPSDEDVPLFAPEAEPQVATADATGFAVVGVTWSGDVSEDSLVVEVRTSIDPEAPADGDAGWDAWQAVEAEPSPDGTLDGTEPLVVGDVARVQARVSGTEPVRDLKLTVVDPGTSPADDDVPTPPEGTSPGGASVAAASAVTTRPSINSRRAWGADESIMSWTPRQGSIRGAAIHHTAGTNNYSRDDVPRIIRGIYAYHAQTRDWGDIGYNFLVDKFGRVWEGRSGGVTRQTIGGHAIGYNTNSTGISVLGNYETATVSNSAVSAVVGLAAWKLSLHGVPASGSTTINGTREQRIFGHRDVASTACPGRTLYAKMSEIRRRATAAQERAAAEQAQGSIADGTFVQNPGGKVALVENGRKHLAYCSVVQDYGERCGSVRKVNSSTWSGLVKSSRLQRTVRSDGRLFWVGRGTKREVFDTASLRRAGKSSPSVSLHPDALSRLPYGNPIVRPGVIVTNRSNGNDRLIINGRKHSGRVGNYLQRNTPLGNLDRGYLDSSSMARLPRVTKTTGVVEGKGGRSYLLTTRGLARTDGTGGFRSSTKSQDWRKALKAEVPQAGGWTRVVAVRQNGKGQIYILRDGVLRPVSKARARQINGGSMPRVHVILKVTRKQFPVGSQL